MTAADPIRRCILLGDRAPRAALVRLALSPDGDVLPDVRAKAPGRGAWIGVTRAELETAILKGKLRGALARAFKIGPIAIPNDLPAKIEAALERAALDRLGLESRSGGLFSGAEKIETAARSGKLHLLLHACDAGTDGNRKLDQAWRVGSDREGEDVRGLVLPVPRTILAVALGRQNVVHIGLTDPDAAKRVRETLDRWLHFIGPDPISTPCETASQGASASPTEAGENSATEHYEEYE
ncbi:transcription terminating nucleic-acid-binding protein [Sphingomonas sp. Leaf357]|uniref:DUF448 domain-containing protein n=1 Tax=Sphingomonas sp. Leaf357 TaxID=1736350 RepID=UPI0006F97657|nr:DUF448 domain-containing protein [Sphingomonas sp. Leaf357]KQS03961.1 transcription terminating nucleic-acid-binding protein [Sphingomonas sp. Leaf357]